MRAASELRSWSTRPMIKESGRTNSTEGDGLGSEEHEVVAVLHAGNDPVPFEVLLNGRCESFVVSLGQLNSPTVVLA